MLFRKPLQEHNITFKNVIHVRYSFQLRNNFWGGRVRELAFKSSGRPVQKATFASAELHYIFNPTNGLQSRL